MTIIVCDKTCLAVDSQETIDTVKSNNCTKLYHYPRYGAVAMAGNSSCADYVARWFFCYGADPIMRKEIIGEWSAILLNTDGRMFRASDNEDVFEVKGVDCIGASAPFAYGAYAACKDVKRATFLTMQDTIYCGGGLSYYTPQTDVAVEAILIEGDADEFFRRRFNVRPKDHGLEQQ